MDVRRVCGRHDHLSDPCICRPLLHAVATHVSPMCRCPFHIILRKT